MKVVASSNLPRLIRQFQVLRQQQKNWQPFFERAGKMVQTGIAQNFASQSADGKNWKPYSLMTFLIADALGAQKAGTTRLNARFANEVRTYTKTRKTKSGIKVKQTAAIKRVAYNGKRGAIVSHSSQSKLLQQNGTLMRAATKKGAKGNVYILGETFVRLGVDLKTKKGVNYPLVQQRGAKIKVSRKLSQLLASHGIYVRAGSVFTLPPRPFFMINRAILIRLQQGALNYFRSKALP